LGARGTGTARDAEARTIQRVTEEPANANLDPSTGPSELEDGMQLDPVRCDTRLPVNLVPEPNARHRHATAEIDEAAPYGPAEVLELVTRTHHRCSLP
jgi:hypothetical protein